MSPYKNFFYIKLSLKPELWMLLRFAWKLVGDQVVGCSPEMQLEFP